MSFSRPHDLRCHKGSREEQDGFECENGAIRSRIRHKQARQIEQAGGDQPGKARGHGLCRAKDAHAHTGFARVRGGQLHHGPNRTDNEHSVAETEHHGCRHEGQASGQPEQSERRQDASRNGPEPQRATLQMGQAPGTDLAHKGCTVLAA